MSAISTYLEYIRTKIYAKDVRTAIVNAISQCYDDVNRPALQTEAMQAAVQAKIDAGEMAALTIADGTITAAKLASGVIPTTDTTLTQSGLPADAKAVGDIVNPMRTATASDAGKALKAKTVTGGKVTEWEFGDVGGSTISCDVDANGNATFSLGGEDFSDIEALVGGTA